MNAHAALPGQIRHDLACESFDDYDRREQMKESQRRGGEEFARRMEFDLLDDSEFYEWADNGGTEELARIACLYVSPWLAAMLAVGAFVLRDA